MWKEVNLPWFKHASLERSKLKLKHRVGHSNYSQISNQNYGISFIGLVEICRIDVLNKTMFYCRCTGQRVMLD